MKKKVFHLYFILLTVIGHSQTLVSPIQNNYLRDDNTDGLVEFNMTTIVKKLPEIKYKIILPIRYWFPSLQGIHLRKVTSEDDKTSFTKFIKN